MGSLMTRGNVLALVRHGYNLLEYSDAELDRYYKKSEVNANAHLTGATIAQAEIIGGSLRTIERGVIKETAKLGGSRVNISDLRLMIEEYGNLKKITL